MSEVQFAQRCSAGDPVHVDCFDNFGGPAVVIETREVPHSRCKVWMLDRNPADPFWAHDSELSALPGDRPYDSRFETMAHILQVRKYLARMTADLARRAEEHDLSKLESPEREVFDEFTPKLKGSTYGSDEYRSFLAEMKRGLDHHYKANSHHPEHYAQEFGEINPQLVASGEAIRDMTLLDLVEMLCDWKAASERHADGDIRRSVEINQARFGYSDELKRILLNTLPVIERA
jgi:hypothetical protein